jgi:hypothetical protein
VKDEEIQSPEAEVKEGGLNWKYVFIYLEPQQEGKWAYEIEIRAEDAHETTPSQEVTIEWLLGLPNLLLNASFLQYKLQKPGSG